MAQGCFPVEIAAITSLISVPSRFFHHYNRFSGVKQAFSVAFFHFLCYNKKK